MMKTNNRRVLTTRRATAVTASAASMLSRTRTVAAALLLSVLVAYPAGAAEPSTVKVALLDMTALFGPGFGPGTGMMGGGNRGGYGPGFGMMGRPYGMMGQGMMMGMMSVRTNVPSMKAGKITFSVSNLSRSVVHELAVVAVDNPSAPLPYDYTTGRVPESQIKILAETEHMEPNAEKTLVIDLKPGSYLLICNLPGHYASGMWTPFTVTE